MYYNPNDYLRLGHKIVHAFLRRNPHLYYLTDDLLQEASLAIVLAAAKFEDRGKVKFSTYCGIEAHNAILKFLRDGENKFRNICPKSVEELVSPETEGDSWSWEDTVSGEVVDIERTLMHLPVDVQMFIHKLNKGRTTRQAREELGCSWEQIEAYKDTISQALKK